MHGGIMVDLNSFKQINDAYGHEEGDAALQNVAEILKCAVNGCGVVIRYGGDEFLIFTREYSDSVQKNIINIINEKVKLYNNIQNKPYKISMSCGKSIFDPLTESLDSVIKRLDVKMYEEKRIYHRNHDRRKSSSDSLGEVRDA